MRITVKAVGDFTGDLAHIKPGTPVVAEGPFGVFTPEARRRPDSLLIAGGIGISPIRALIEEIPGDLAIIYRVVRELELIFREEIEAIARRRAIAVHYILGDHRTPGCENLLSPAHLRQLVPDIEGRDIFLCGPPPMMTSVERNLRQAGVPASSIHSERFAL